MVILKILFPAHRYHATPWGNHVNEGLVEWPPSPWRLLRAFYSVGYTHLGWHGEPPTTFESLVDALCEIPPAYSLPPSVVTHSRHYMPVPGTSSKVLDAWRRVVDDEAILIRFDADLSDDQRLLLKQLAEHTSYLGRAESWVDIQVLDHDHDNVDVEWCLSTSASTSQLGATSQRVLMPLQSTVYQEWREQSSQQTLEREQKASGKKLTKAQTAQIQLAYPKSVIECLAIDSNWMSRHGWSQPPGTQWVSYSVIEKPIPRLRASVKNSKREPHEMPTTALISLTSDTVSGKTLPPLASTLFVAEAVHKATVKAMDRMFGSVSPILHGRGDEHRHGHAHYLPADLDCDGRIDHVFIHCTSGLSDEVQRAIASVTRLWAHNLPEIKATWIGASSIDRLRVNLQRNHRNLPSIFDVSSRFISVTPYVASRHLRRKYQLRENVIDECLFRGLPAPIRVESIRPNAGRYRLCRIDDARKPPVEFGQFIEIEFDEPIRAPLSIGYGSHFGLGLFAAQGP